MTTRTSDECVVDRALSRFARRDARIRRLTRRVLAAQRALHRLVDERAWQAFLTVEAAANARDYEIQNAAIRIALRRGRRARD